MMERTIRATVTGAEAEAVAVAVAVAETEAEADPDAEPAEAAAAGGLQNSWIVRSVSRTVDTHYLTTTYSYKS